MITLTLPYPISANRYWRTTLVCGRPSTYVSPEAKKFRAEVYARFLEQGFRKPITGRVAFDVKLFPHRPLDFKKRMREFGNAWDDGVLCIDLDNANKVLLDSLKGVAIEDDKWVRRLTSERMEPDGGEARVVVTITPIAVVQPVTDLFEAAA